MPESTPLAVTLGATHFIRSSGRRIAEDVIKGICHLEISNRRAIGWRKSLRAGINGQPASA
jgi:hypothetical protein